MSKDGEIVIMHDGTVDRTTNGTGNVSDFTVKELKELTVDSAAEKYPDRVDKILTLEEIFQAFQGTDAVIYCHMGSGTAMLARFKELVTKYGMEDNAIAFCRYNTAAGYRNSDFGNGLSFISGNSNGIYDPATGELAMDSQNHALESMIKVFGVYNHQAMLYEYDELSNSGKDDTFYYKMSARGFLGLHSTTNVESTFDRYFATGSGIAGALTDYPGYASDYCVEIEADDVTLIAGGVVELEKTVKKGKGEDITKTCGIEVLSGELTETDGAYTMKEAGSCTVVYYADITAADSGVAYRLYSQPVIFTFAASAELDSDADLSALNCTVGEKTIPLAASQLVQAMRA